MNKEEAKSHRIENPPSNPLPPPQNIKELGLPDEKYEMLRHILSRAYRRKCGLPEET